MLLEAQEKYKRSNSYRAVCALQNIQGKHESAKREFENLFEKEER
jgi:hypothetical protein